MNDRPITQIETIYFPISFLRDFENEPQKTARKILTYVFNTIQKKTSKADATKKIGFTEFEQYGKIPKNQPQTYFNINHIKQIANGFEQSKFDISLLLYVCAVRSILLNKKAVKSTWKMIAARMSGFSYFGTNNDLNNSAARLLKRADTYRNNLKEEAFSRFGVGFYSCVGVRGFYVWRDMTFAEFVKFYNDDINKEKKKTIIQAKEETYMQKVAKNTIEEIVKVFTAEPMNEKELQYIRDNWSGKNIKELEKILREKLCKKFN